MSVLDFEIINNDMKARLQTAGGSNYGKRPWLAAVPGLIFFFIGLMPADAQSARDRLRSGMDHYLEEQYEEAVRDFREAALAAERERLDPAIALFNKGNAYYRKRDYEEALAMYSKALRSEDMDLHESAYYNRGNAFTALSGRMEREGRLDAALENIERALSDYENVLTLNPHNRDARINHELAARRKEQLERYKKEQPHPSPDPDTEEHRDEPGEDEHDAPGDPDLPAPDDEHPPEIPEDAETPTEPVDEDPRYDITEEMTTEEALMMLDALKEEEDAYRNERRHRQRPLTDEVDKDW